MPEPTLTPTPVAPVATIQPGGLGAPPTLESLANQIATLQSQLQSLSANYEAMLRQANANSASLAQLSQQFGGHTHVVSQYQYTITVNPGDPVTGINQQTYTVPAISVVDDTFPNPSVPVPHPVMSGPPVAEAPP